MDQMEKNEFHAIVRKYAHGGGNIVANARTGIVIEQCLASGRVNKADLQRNGIDAQSLGVIMGNLRLELRDYKP